MQKRIPRSPSTIYYPPSTNHGFSIVELVVVIFVIAIITTLTSVGFNLVLSNTVTSSLKSNLESASKQLVVDQTRSTSGVYPNTLADANNGLGINFNGSTTTTYIVDNTDNPRTFCLTATQSNQTYFVTQESSPMPGPCPVLYLDAGIFTSYPGTGTAWNDLSGNGNNGILNNNVGYSAIKSGVLTFNGSNNYASTSTAPNISSAGSLSAWVYVNAWGPQYDAIIFKGPGTSWADIDYGLFRSGSSSTFLGTLNDGTNNLAGGGPTSSAISLGQWYNLVFTWNGSVTKFYTNNALTGSVNYGYGDGSRSTNMTVGSDVTGSTYFFNGYISNVRIYNVALSATDVSNNFNALRSRYGL